ncbi:MAG: LysM peptidoglycan-binding domain-containing protein [Butyrivibrio sp.]|nr:LysM peptidoglycan-binding domain-containing protein [Butyrivibrio sp.]
MDTIKTKKTLNSSKSLALMMAIVLIVTSLMALPAQEVRAAGTSLNTTAQIEKIQKYGNVVLDLTCKELLSSGYEYGDVLNVSFLDQNLALPLCSNYSDVDSGNAAIFAREKDEYVQLAINMKDFATTYGIATKNTAADNSVTWQPADGGTNPVKISISMDTKGGYYGEYLLHQMSYTTNREDYPDLSDEQFANFREVTTTGIGRGKLYRSASPVNPEFNRNTYADAAIRKAKVTTIMNLADDPETIAAYPGVYATYYSQQNYITLNMGVDFESDDFKQKLAQGIRYFIEKPGVYLVHCTEGKDRAGYVVAVLECLMGANYDEVAADYMTTFYNYYGITQDDERYNSILTSNIEKSLKRAFGVEDIKTADLSAKASEYLKSTGITDEEIAALKQNLSGAEETVPVEAAPSEETPIESAPADSATDAASAYRTYVVKPGDSLCKIAKEIYGDIQKWTYIYELNKDIISNPNIIYSGQEIKLGDYN